MLPKSYILGIWSSAIDYYATAGKSLLAAEAGGSRMPDLHQKTSLYCRCATYLALWLDNKKAEAERDWDKLDDAEASD